MTASRNTILALGLMWIALAAGNLALAAPTGDGGPCGEATCGGGANVRGHLHDLRQRDVHARLRWNGRFLAALRAERPRGLRVPGLSQGLL